jgi:hypothetical protein
MIHRYSSQCSSRHVSSFDGVAYRGLQDFQEMLRHRSPNFGRDPNQREEPIVYIRGIDKFDHEQLRNL